MAMHAHPRGHRARADTTETSNFEEVDGGTPKTHPRKVDVE
ncbi:MAG: hypothetical protein AAFU79_30550 [Myxococcota bacterium]